MLTATQSEALGKVMDRYEVQDPDDVRKFLEERPEIAELFARVLDVVPHYFGQSATIALALRDDPAGIEPRYVAGYIRTSLPSPERLDVLGRLKDEWWLDASEGIRDEVLLSLNPVRA